MRSYLNILAALLLGATLAPAAIDQTAKTRARLVLSAETALPGATVMAGVHLRMPTNWHVYWKNSGGSGIPTSIEWELPDGITAGEIQWPVPEKIPPDDLVTYGYHEQVVLLVPLNLAQDLTSGEHQIKAHVEWLECESVCIAGQTNLTASLTVGTASTPSDTAQLIETWKAKLPKSAEGLNARAWWDGAGADDTRAVIFEWQTSGNPSSAEFLPESHPAYEMLGATERLESEAGTIRIRKEIKRYKGNEWPKTISGVLAEITGHERVGYEVDLEVGEKSGAAIVSGGAKLTVWKSLFYAFLGGLILNIMPCVLPVIALKILGFVNDAKNHPRQVRLLGLVYATGVLTSFLVLAGILVGLKAAGQSVGWGFQFGSPYFLIAMTTLLVLIVMNLFGVFEVTLGSGTMGVATSLSARHGSAGAFFNGFLATALATSCSAPLLGSAIGFALAQPDFMIVLIMLMVGLGLAFPYVVLSWHPAWLKFLPKPGPWMERFKVLMGFPMLAAAVWLLSIVAVHYGDRVWWLVMFLVFVAIAGWIYGEFFQRGRKHRGIAIAAALLVLATGYAYALESKLRWREPGVAKTGSAVASLAPAGFDWQPWSAEAVAKARAEGRPVAVDFTAKWCPTCNTIVKPAFGLESVREKLKKLNAVALLGDYTLFPPEISDELARHGRAAVPLVLVYPPAPEEPPIVLPEPSPFMLPSQYSSIILKALDQATK